MLTVRERTDRDEWAELYHRARRAINETRKLAEDHRFIVSWVQMRPDRNARFAPVLDE
jgi:hypothetical protein